MEEVGFKQHIYEKYKEHFNPFLRLHRLAELSLSNYRGFTKNPYDASLVLIFPRAYKSFDSIRRLCEVALCEDAAVILRCLLNLLVVTRWIELNPKVRAEKYIRWYWVAMHRETENSKVSLSGALQTELQAKYDSAKRLFEYTDNKGCIKIAKHWYSSEVNSLFDMFKEVGLETHYNEGYRLLSGVEHSDAMAYFAMLRDSERSESERQLAVQSDLFIPAYLRNAFQYFGAIFRICNNTIPLAEAKTLDEIVVEGMNFYAAEISATSKPTP